LFSAHPGYVFFIFVLSLLSYQIWAEILRKWGTQNYNQDQVYAYWSHINKNVWQLANDQVESACLGLQAAGPSVIEGVPITIEDDISTIAFLFKENLDRYGEQTLEVAMDSTCGLITIYPINNQP
jgi:hypothetical protein